MTKSGLELFILQILLMLVSLGIGFLIGFFWAAKKWLYYVDKKIGNAASKLIKFARQKKK